MWPPKRKARRESKVGPLNLRTKWRELFAVPPRKESITALVEALSAGRRVTLGRYRFVPYEKGTRYRVEHIKRTF